MDDRPSHGAAPARPHVGRAGVMAVLLTAALLAAAALLGCKDDSTKSTVDPTTVIDQSVTAMEALKSFHFTYEVQKPQNAKPSSGLEISRIIGDVVAGGEMKASIDLLQAGLPLKLNFISTGSTHYLQDPTSQKWQSIPANLSPVGTLNLSTGAIGILKKIQDLKNVGVEDIGGVKVYHLTGSVPPAEVAAIAGASSAKEPYAGDIWIGTEDHLVRRIKIVGAATSGEDPKTVRVIDLSAFDEPVTIEAPK